MRANDVARFLHSLEGYATTNHTTAISEIRPGGWRGAGGALGDAHTRGSRRNRWQAHEIRRARCRCRVRASSSPRRAGRTRTRSRSDRSTGSFIRSCRRRRSGRTTTAPGSPARPARSEWRSLRKAARRCTVSFTHDLPATYPAWLPVDTRLTPLGNQVRLMTHLHGGFVAADSDGNPAVTPNGFGPGETQTCSTPIRCRRCRRRCCGSTITASARRDSMSSPASPPRTSSAMSTTPGQSPTRSAFPAVRTRFRWSSRTGSSTPTGRSCIRRATFPGVTWIGEYFGDVMLVNGKVWPLPRRRAADVPVPHPQRLQRADPESRHRRPDALADRRRGRPVRRAGAGEADGAGAGRARRRARRLQQVRRRDAGDEEPQAAEAGVESGARSSSRSCRFASARRSPSPAPPRFRRACPAARPICAIRSRRATSRSTRSIRRKSTWYLNLNGVRLRRRADDGDAEGRHGGGLGLRQS